MTSPHYRKKQNSVGSRAEKGVFTEACMIQLNLQYMHGAMGVNVHLVVSTCKNITMQLKGFKWCTWVPLQHCIGQVVRRQHNHSPSNKLFGGLNASQHLISLFFRQYL